MANNLFNKYDLEKIGKISFEHFKLIAKDIRSYLDLNFSLNEKELREKYMQFKINKNGLLSNSGIK